MGTQQEGSTKLDVEALVQEAYEALKAMVEEEEIIGAQSDSSDLELVGLPDEADMAHVEAEGRYHGSTGEGAECDTLSTCGERPTKYKVEFGEITIMGLERD